MALETPAVPKIPTQSTSTDSLTGLYSKSPGTAQVKQVDTVQAASATSSDATGKGYLSTSRDIASGDLSSNQLNDITSQDSPLMQRAKSEGMLTAAKRGLQNSSIAAGAVQGAMVDKATPLALQDAQTTFTQGRANQDATNTAAQFGADAENAAALQNAKLATDVSQQNAALQTDVSKSNAALTQDTNTTNANAENAMRANILQQNSELNKQYLAGSQALDLAAIQGQYQQLISTNETASSLYNGYMQSISEMMANKDLSPERVATSMGIQQQMLASGLRYLGALNNLDLSGSLAAGGSPTGTPAPSGGTSATDPATGVPITTAPATKRIGDTDLPSGYTTRQSGRGGGYYDVLNENGDVVGKLTPGGKNGRYTPV